MEVAVSSKVFSLPVLHPHTLPLLQHGVASTGHGPSWIAPTLVLPTGWLSSQTAPAWVPSVWCRPSGADCCRVGPLWAHSSCLAWTLHGLQLPSGHIHLLQSGVVHRLQCGVPDPTAITAGREMAALAVLQVWTTAVLGSRPIFHQQMQGWSTQALQQFTAHNRIEKFGFTSSSSYLYAGAHRICLKDKVVPPHVR